MIALRLPGQLSHTARFFAMMPVFYGIISLLQLHEYVQWHAANFVIGGIGLPFMISAMSARPRSLRYGWTALFFSGFYFFFPVKTCQYAALIFALLFAYESLKGKTSLLVLLTLVLMSPIAQYFADAFSFPLRLRLTMVAGYVMQMAGQAVSVSGNVITSHGTDFSVDPACMGLNMLVSSLLCCLLIIAVYQKKFVKQLSTVWILSVCCLAILLNILSNLIRIIMLVQFSIMPGTVMHELMGIFCLVLYVIIPALTGLQWLVKKVGKSRALASEPSPTGSIYISLHFIIGLVLISGCVLVPALNAGRVTALPAVPGYTAKHHDADIVKLENGTALIYLKDLKGFYASEHHPMLCWTGGGYKFARVEERRIAGVPVISGTLQKGDEILYTAWWYSDGKTPTSSGLGWRWDALRNGHPYSIVNITTTDELTLQTEIGKIILEPNLNGWLDRTSR